MSVTASPLWLLVAVFQDAVIFWSPGKANPRVQLLIVDVPVFLMTTLAVKPPGHWLVVA